MVTLCCLFDQKTGIALMVVSALIKITLRLIKCTQNWYTDVKTDLSTPECFLTDLRVFD